MEEKSHLRFESIAYSFTGFLPKFLTYLFTYSLAYLFTHLFKDTDRKVLLLLKDTRREKLPQIKLQRFRKVWIWTFGCLLYQINSLYEVIKFKQNFRKNKIVTGKTMFFMICPFCTPHSICHLNIGFWQSSFVGKCCVFNLILSTKKWYSQFFEKSLRFSKKIFKVEVLKTFKVSSNFHIKTCRSLKGRGILKIPRTVFGRTYALAVGFKMKPLRNSVFLMLTQKPTQILP